MGAESGKGLEYVLREFTIKMAKNKEQISLQCWSLLIRNYKFVSGWRYTYVEAEKVAWELAPRLGFFWEGSGLQINARNQALISNPCAVPSRKVLPTQHRPAIVPWCPPLLGHHGTIVLGYDGRQGSRFISPQIYIQYMQHYLRRLFFFHRTAWHLYQKQLNIWACGLFLNFILSH